MTQSRGVILDIPTFGNILLSVAKNGTDIARNLRKYFLDKQIDKFNREDITREGSGISLGNNEINDIMKLIVFKK